MPERSKANACLAPHVSDPAVEELLDNIDGYIHGPVSGFVLHRDDVVQKAAREIGDRYSLSSAVPPPEGFLRWFSSFPLEELNGARSAWHTCCRPASELEIASGGAHLFLTLSTMFDHSAKNGRRDVQVSRDDSIGYQDGLLSLCGHARKSSPASPREYSCMACTYAAR
jgi:hypothetical protein